MAEVGTVQQTLADWLLERINDEKAAAEKAQEFCDWCEDPGLWRFEPRDGGNSGQGTVWNGVGQAVVSHSRHWQGEHIAYWQPARVLAEVNSKRRIIDEHLPMADWVSPIDGQVYPASDADRQQCRSCGWAEDWEQRENGPTFPCPTLRLLALPYQGLPG